MLLRLIVAISLAVFALASGVTLSGTVFDSSLVPVSAIVTLENPMQVAVAANGTYSFEVAPSQNYTLIAKTTGTNPFEEKVTIGVGETDTRFDIILLTAGEPDQELNQINETLQTLTEPEIDINVLEDQNQINYLAIAFAAIVMIVAITLALHARKKRRASAISIESTEPPRVESEEKTAGKLDSFKLEILKQLKQNEGAMEQKALRRELPWSEARVSIELSELEKMGKIKKVKKGRANLVKLA